MAARFIRRGRFIGDDRNLITLDVNGEDNTVDIAVGDFVSSSSGEAFSFASLVDQGTKQQNQRYAAAHFRGIAQSSINADDSGTITIAREGVFEVPCTSDTYTPGDFVTPIGTGTASAVGVSATTVEKTTDPASAIGTVVQSGSSVTTIQIELKTVYNEVPDGQDTFYVNTISDLDGTGVALEGVTFLSGALTMPVAGLLSLGSGTVAAAGSVQGDAAALSRQITYVTAVDGTKGVVLPTATAGAFYLVYNTDAALGLKIYPASGDDINDGTTDAAVTIEGKTLALFVALDSTTWAAIYTANT